MSSLEKLRSPLHLPCGAVLPNRLCKAAMTEGLSRDGNPDVELERLYRVWSRCGAGMLLTGNVQIDRRHLERPGNVILDRKPEAKTREAFARWASVAKEGGAKAYMQISHAGRQTPALVNPRPFAPSAVPLAIPGRFGSPVEMPEPEIERAIEGFARASVAAREYGFDGVQIHAAHGYLISSFLNPLANRRQDKWGGPLENRARLLLETIARVRSATGSDFPVCVKLNSADFQQGGFDFEDTIVLAGWLADASVDLLEVSGGNYESGAMMGAPGEQPKRASTRAREAYFLDFAKIMRAARTPPLMVTGGFRTAAAMIEALDSDIDMIGIGRPLCAELDGPARLLAGEISELARYEDMILAHLGEIGDRPGAAGELPEGFGVIAWFYQQLRLIGKGLAPDPHLDVVKAFLDERRDDAALARLLR